MKNIYKIFLIGSFFLLALNTFAQVPDGISYQAVAIDENGKEIPGVDVFGNVIPEKAIGVRFTILKTSATGEIVYQETHTTYTDSYGLFSLVIGHGVVSTTSPNTSLVDINWVEAPMFLKVELDVENSGEYKSMGVQQLMSVPYAYYAESADYNNLQNKPNIPSDIADLTDQDELLFDGDYNSLDNLPELNVTQWDEAYSWGNHADAGYLTEQSEIDPIFTSHFDFTGATTNDLLRFDGTKWVKYTPDYISDYTVTEDDVTNHEGAITITESQISDLGNYLTTETDPVFNSLFDFTGVTTNDLLRFDGTKWVRFTPDYISDYTVTEEDVTNHEGSITITESQITDLGNYLTAETDPVFNSLFDFTGVTTNDLLRYDGTKWVIYTPDFAETAHTHANATTTDPGFMSAADKLKLDGLQNADGSETVITAGDNISINGTGTSADPYVVGYSSGTRYLGEEYLGGIIFYLYYDASGTQKGLIVSTTEASTAWQNAGSLTGAYRTDDGAFNTALLSDSPAKDWVAGNFSAEWYLPSIDELAILFNNRFFVNKGLRAGSYTEISATSTYWSSTESNATGAFSFGFPTGVAGLGNSSGHRTKTNTNSVRAIRAF